MKSGCTGVSGRESNKLKSLGDKRKESRGNDFSREDELFQRDVKWSNGQEWWVRYSHMIRIGLSKSPDIASDLNEKLSAELSKLSELNRSGAVLVDLLNQHCQLLRCWTEPHRPDKIFEFFGGSLVERNIWFFGVGLIVGKEYLIFVRWKGKFDLWGLGWLVERNITSSPPRYHRPVGSLASSRQTIGNSWKGL